MEIIEKLLEFQKRNNENCIFLLEYELFFNENLAQYCQFAIDEEDELTDLKDIIKRLKEDDNNMSIYVYIYIDEIMNSQGYINIYGDSLWMETKISLDKLKLNFAQKRNIEPSDIELVGKLDEYKESKIILLKNNGELVNLRKIFNNNEIESIKSLYWD